MKTDFYTLPHKMQRQQMFEFSHFVAMSDFASFETLELIEKKLRSLVTELKEHAFHEETFIHPLLVRKLPRVEKQIRDEHHELTLCYTQLENQLDHLKNTLNHAGKVAEQGLAFYRSLNQFIAEYLIHTNKEEELSFALWELSLPQELEAMMLAFRTYAKFEAQEAIAQALMQYNAQEQKHLFQTIELLAPSEVYQGFCEIARCYLKTSSEANP